MDRRQFILLVGVGAAAAATECQSAPVAVMTETYPEPEQIVSKNGVPSAAVTVTRQPVDIDGQQIVGTVYNGSFVARPCACVLGSGSSSP